MVLEIEDVFLSQLHYRSRLLNTGFQNAVMQVGVVRSHVGMRAGELAGCGRTRRSVIPFTRHGQMRTGLEAQSQKAAQTSRLSRAQAARPPYDKSGRGD
jgi:hypothetical protein